MFNASNADKSIFPAAVTIEPHLEMSYNGNRKPDRIIFFCRRAVHDPESGKPFKDGGGEITLTDMRRVTNGLDTKGLLKRICEEGIRYWRTLPDQNIRGEPLILWAAVHLLIMP